MNSIYAYSVISASSDLNSHALWQSFLIRMRKMTLMMTARRSVARLCQSLREEKRREFDLKVDLVQEMRNEKSRFAYRTFPVVLFRMFSHCGGTSFGCMAELQLTLLATLRSGKSMLFRRDSWHFLDENFGPHLEQMRVGEHLGVVGVNSNALGSMDSSEQARSPCGNVPDECCSSLACLVGVDKSAKVFVLNREEHSGPRSNSEVASSKKLLHFLLSKDRKTAPAREVSAMSTIEISNEKMAAYRALFQELEIKDASLQSELIAFVVTDEEIDPALRELLDKEEKLLRFVEKALAIDLAPIQAVLAESESRGVS